MNNYDLRNVSHSVLDLNILRFPPAVDVNVLRLPSVMDVNVLRLPSVVNALRFI